MKRWAEDLAQHTQATGSAQPLVTISHQALGFSLPLPCPHLNPESDNSIHSAFLREGAHSQGPVPQQEDGAEILTGPFKMCPLNPSLFGWRQVAKRSVNPK